MNGWIYFALIFSGIIILLAMLRTKRFFTMLMLTALQGLAAFFAVNFVGGFFGVHLALNWGHLGISAFGGMPGVILLLLVNTMFCR
ncbi:MAG: pro-sigmaK processing inhibitor BofA family protein [Candidatus Fimenecus sp.]